MSVPQVAPAISTDRLLTTAPRQVLFCYCYDCPGSCGMSQTQHWPSLLGVYSNPQSARPVWWPHADSEVRAHLFASTNWAAISPFPNFFFFCFILLLVLKSCHLGSMPYRVVHENQPFSLCLDPLNITESRYYTVVTEIPHADYFIHSDTT